VKILLREKQGLLVEAWFQGRKVDLVHQHCDAPPLNFLFVTEDYQEKEGTEYVNRATFYRAFSCRVYARKLTHVLSEHHKS
jgi:hypothetical protein